MVVLRKPPFSLHPAFQAVREWRDQLVGDLIESVTRDTGLPAPVATALFQAERIPILNMLAVQWATRAPGETREERSSNDAIGSALYRICSDQVYEAAQALKLSGDLARKVVRAAEKCLRDTYSMKPVADNQAEDYNVVPMRNMAAQYYAVADDAFKRGLSVAEFREATEDKLAAKGQDAARETTSRPATATPRPETAPAASPEPVSAPAWPSEKWDTSDEKAFHKRGAIIEFLRNVWKPFIERTGAVVTHEILALKDQGAARALSKYIDNHGAAPDDIARLFPKDLEAVIADAPLVRARAIHTARL